MPYRVDRGSLGEGRIDHNGSLIVKGVLTRTGVFKYSHRDGSVTHELRHPDDVFAVDAVASFAQVPITNEHPTGGKVTPENSKQLMVGNLGDSLSREGPTKNFVASDLIIRDQDVIDAVMGKDGQPKKRFLSCGYKADVIPESGEYMGEKFDHRQTNIKGNHVAIVRSPRAGPVARLLLDSEDATIDESEDVWMADVVQEVVNKTVQDALELVEADESFNQDAKDAVSAKIKKIAADHPEWDHDQVVAVAHSMTGKSKKKDDINDMEKVVIGKTEDGSKVYAVGKELEEHSEMEYETRVIGTTQRGKEIYASHKGMDYDDWTVEDHRDASWASKREHGKLRDTLATSQSIMLGEEAESKIKGMMAKCKAAHDYHKSEAMTLDSESIEVDEEGWITDASYSKGMKKSEHGSDEEEEAKKVKMKTQTKGDIVRIKRDAVTIGSGDNELHLDAVTIDVDDESEDSLELLLQRQDELVEYAREKHADAEEARGERDAAMARIQDPTKLDELARERTDILGVAEFVGLKKDELREIPNEQIKRMVVAKHQPDLINDDSSEEYTQGCYNMITADAANVSDNKDKLDKLGQNVSSHREDGKEAKVDGEGEKLKLTYSEQARLNLQNVHTDSQEELEKRFSN